MKRLLLVLGLACPCAALADVGLKNAGTYVGPVRDLNCTADAGIVCTRVSSAVRGDLACATATATATGCVTSSTQTMGGDKTFTGNVTSSGTMKAAVLDAGAAYAGGCSFLGGTGSCPVLDAGFVTAAYVGAGFVDAGVLASYQADFRVWAPVATPAVQGIGLGLTATGATGGQATSSAGQPAGAGGSITWQAGQGGTAISSAGTAPGSTGGDGGYLLLAAGPGGSTVSASQSGGTGGAATLMSGAGGKTRPGGQAAVVAGVGGDGYAGAAAAAGGSVLLQSGNGGAQNSGVDAGPGGDVWVLGGTGGTNGTGVPAHGGNVYIYGGDAGAGVVGVTDNVPGGNVTIDTGSSVGASGNATVSIGFNNARTILIGGAKSNLGIVANGATLTVNSGAVSFTGGVNGSAFSQLVAASKVIDFTSISAQTCQNQTDASSFTALSVGDSTMCGWPSTLENGLAGTCFVSASNTVTYRLCNVTSGAIDPASQTFKAWVIH